MHKFKKKRCKFVGLIIKKIPMFKCRVKRYKNDRQSRKQCCSWLKVCAGTLCKEKNRKCKWTGVIIKRKSWVKKKIMEKNKKILS